MVYNNKLLIDKHPHVHAMSVPHVTVSWHACGDIYKSEDSNVMQNPCAHGSQNWKSLLCVCVYKGGDGSSEVVLPFCDLYSHSYILENP